MSNAATAMDVKLTESFADSFSFEKIGFLVAVGCLALLDGVNGAMCSTLRQYLMGGFSATADQVTWGAIFYYVGKLYMLLLAAKLQRRFGQRRSYLTASVVLVLATASGGFITHFSSLLPVLLLQGCSGGAMVAMGQGTLLMIFPRREQSLVQGVYALATVMFPATIVPAFLGSCAYDFNWRDAYLGIVPFGLLGCGWLLWKRKLLSAAVSPTEFLPVRIILMVTALFAIVYVLQQGDRNCWLEYPPIVWALLLAVACIVGLVFIETSGGPTFLPYGSFHYANFTFGMCVVLLAGSRFLEAVMSFRGLPPASCPIRYRRAGWSSFPAPSLRRLRFWAWAFCLGSQHFRRFLSSSSACCCLAFRCGTSAMRHPTLISKVSLPGSSFADLQRAASLFR